jgi:peptidyl-prolyl cis-trans isomerase SurA
MYVFAPRTEPAAEPAVAGAGPADEASDDEAAVAHILIAHSESEPPIEGVTRSRSEARELALRLGVIAGENDADFAALAREYSDDPRAEKTGGYLGIMPRGSAPLSFQVPLFNLEPGQVHFAAETAQGFHVIKRMAVRRAEARHILITWEGSEATAVHASRTRNQALLLAEEILGECRREDADFCELTARYSDDTGSRFQCGSVGVIEPGMTDAAFENALFRLRSGEVSDIVETPYGFHIIQRP